MTARPSSARLSLADVLSKKHKIGPLRGVYFLFQGGELVYIGKTPNVYRRLGEHLSTKKIDYYYLLPLDCGDDELSAIERKYITEFMPKLNKQKRFWDALESNGISDKTASAMAYIAAGETPYAAAKRVGIALSTIYRALKRIRERQ